MADRHSSFAELVSVTQGQGFLIRLRRRKSGTVIIAPHGGGIEPGTSEIAEAIAAGDHSFYAFEGMRKRGNRGLHITSTRFDEGRCVALVQASARVLAVHGEEGREQVVYLGGLDGETLGRLEASLERQGFRVRTPRLGLQGRERNNICNRTATGRGVQLELSRGLRLTFFSSFTRRGRETTTARFGEFVAAVHEAVT